LYQLQIAGQSGYLYCVVEHVSQAKALTAFQVLRYQIAILHQHTQQQKKAKRKSNRLPLVIPLIFYRGKESPYPYSTDIMNCFEAPHLAREIFLQPYPLIDLSVISDEAIKTHKSIALFELLQKHIHDREHFKTQFIQWLQEGLYQFVTPYLFQLMVNYALMEAQVEDVTTFIQAFEAITIEEEYKQSMQTAAHYLEQRGLHQGLQQGKNEAKREDAQLMLSEGLSLALVKKITQLSDEELAELV